MGRDSTAGKRMAAKRSREKAAGLRRLNVAVKPEVLDRLAWLMTQHNCASQAAVIEMVVMAECTASVGGTAKDACNEVTDVATDEAHKAPSGKKLKKTSPAESSKDEDGGVTDRKKISVTQMELF